MPTYLILKGSYCYNRILEVIVGVMLTNFGDFEKTKVLIMKPCFALFLLLVPLINYLTL
jgi:hypothetical protein